LTSSPSIPQRKKTALTAQFTAISATRREGEKPAGDSKIKNKAAEEAVLFLTK